MALDSKLNGGFTHRIRLLNIGFRRDVTGCALKVIRNSPMIFKAEAIIL